ncbi:type IV secretion system protein TraC [Escherichia coli]|nr:type IV secretion system protein TraC [Escherichia coli]EFN3698581.1 type IV secretion system protein TraC [Escherichia coli]EFO5583059.1 type IV secretion system protein TraC [Escherichia coli]
MNNPLEAVTQAVNSLVTALKLPDESAKANEVLGEMSFPQFSRLLPYRDYNQESGLFMNDTTMGFMLEAIPINGANESIVEALDHMLRTKLPRGVPFCIHLMSSQLVGDRIEYGLREFSWSGEQAERFNAITRAYYMNAAATQFPLPEGMNLPLTLRHYRVFFSYCSPSKKKSRADILEMENLVKIIRASLQGASITTQAVDAQAFIDIVGEMINHNPDSLYPKRRQLDPYSDLNYQCVEDSFDLKVRADYLTLGLRENGRNSTARILNFHLARNPEIAFLWNMADNYSNLLNPELSISCPFILTLTLVVEDQVKTHSEANLKYMDLEKKSKTSYAKWFPSVEKEAKEWGELRQRLGSGQSSVVSYFLNITAFCKDNNETALEVEQDILNSFRKNGFELISPRFNHMRNFLTCLPFMAGKGLFKQLKEAGVVQRAESFNVANLMPLVADNPLTPAGLLAPTYRNQLAFIDIFFRGMNNTNYNMAVCGTSGAGKTGLIQPLIRSVLDSGGFAVVFDMGDGYKSLCENMGGVYLDGETLRFNPFANITDIDQSAERVRDQLSVMASPNGSVVDGNYSYGNMQTENVNGFSWSTNSTTSFGQMMYQTGSGATATQTRDGNMVMDASGAMSRLPVGINTTRQIAAAQQEMAREASNRAESALHGFSSSIASAWNTLSQFGSNRGSSDSVTGGADSTMSAQDSMMASRMRSAVESYAKAHNISNEQATRELASRSTTASAGLYGDAHAGLDAKPSLFGVRVDVGAKVGGRASIDGSDLDSHEASSGSRASHDARHDIDARASKDFKEASDYFTSRKVSESGSHTDNNADSRVDQLSAALNSAKQSYDQYTTNMTRSHEYAEMASRTESMSGQMSEDLSQQFAQYVMKHAPQDAEAILTNTSSPEIAERRRAMAWSFVQEQVQPGVDNAWRESRGDIGKGMESVPSGGGSQDIIADHQGHQAIIEQRTQDSNIRNDVKHQVDNMVTEYRGNIGNTQSSIHGEENIVGRQYSELQNHHKTEALSQNNKYDEERESQKIIPEPSGEAVKEMIDGKKERLKGPL